MKRHGIKEYLIDHLLFKVDWTVVAYKFLSFNVYKVDDKAYT
jgi:hypothetical protein